MNALFYSRLPVWRATSSNHTALVNYRDIHIDMSYHNIHRGVSPQVQTTQESPTGIRRCRLRLGCRPRRDGAHSPSLASLPAHIELHTTGAYAIRPRTGCLTRYGSSLIARRAARLATIPQGDASLC